MTVVAHLEPLERALVAASFPSMSPWWRATIGRFYSTAARTLVLRVGRRGGKSSTLCRVAVLEALFGEHKIPRGDVGIVGIVSVSREEAGQRLRTVRAILDALRVAYRPIESGIELAARPIAFKTFAATLGGVVGGTWICGICDEVSRWRDSDTGANPATEVLASLRPTMATQRSARLFLSSSPLGLLDAHAKAFELGSTDGQLVAHAPTWAANPSITEAETRALEPNERIWRREFAAEPQGDLTSVFDLDLIDRAMRPRPAGVRIAGEYERVLAIDASRGRDAWTFAIARWTVEENDTDDADTRPAPSGLPFVREVPPRAIKSLNALEARFEVSLERQDIAGHWWPYDPSTRAMRRSVLHVEEIGEVPDGSRTEDAIAFIARLAARPRLRAGGAERIQRLCADQYEFGALGALLRRVGLRPSEHKWSAPSKARAVDRLERLLRDDYIRLPAHDTLRRQLSEYSEKITRTGALTYSGKGAHDDYVQALVTLAMADVEGALEGSTTSRLGHRHMLGRDNLPTSVTGY